MVDFVCQYYVRHCPLYEEYLKKTTFWEIRGSSVSIVPGTTGVRSPTEVEGFSSSLCVQTGSGAHPASCPMGTGGSFPGGKARPGMTLTTHLHLVPRLSMSSSYTSSLPMFPMACNGTALHYFTTFWK
jgi:hypothetical protein